MLGSGWKLPDLPDSHHILVQGDYQALVDLDHTKSNPNVSSKRESTSQTRQDDRRGKGIVVAEEENERDEDIHNGTEWWQIALIIAAIILGLGVLGLPYAFTTTGWILGPITKVNEP